jgi:hypothetical protein
MSDINAPFLKAVGTAKWPMEVHPRLELGFPRYDGGVLPLHQQTIVVR